MFFKSILLALSIGLFSFFLTACGGGGGSTNTSINPQPSNPLSFDPLLAQTLQIPESNASVLLSANTLVREDGSLPVGNVVFDLKTLNPAVSLNNLPGDLFVKTAGNSIVPFESLGALRVTFTDSEGNPLKLIAGANALFRISFANKSANPPAATVPLFYYDEIQQLWIEEGVASLLTDDTGAQFYEGNVSNLSTWTAGNIYSQINIISCVEDSNDTPLSIENVKIISEGIDYSGKTESVSDAQGNYSVAVKQNAEVLIHGELNGVKSSTIKINTSTDDQTLVDCLKFSSGLDGNVNISIKASWGASPVNLDASLSVPNRSNVFFNLRGSLTESPFIQLDVVDTDGYGPEVMTIFKFENNGLAVYRYTISNFSINFDVGITNSPATVELNVNGDVTVFTPPPEEGTNLIWNVFDIIVDTDGAFTISPVNTWSPIFVDGN